MEQIRVVKEMRDECIRQLRMRGADEPVRPRFMVWENVPGAFTSNGGEDFRIVLEECAKISESNASIPRLASGQSWSNAGCILGDGWSLAWRLHDAQFWGVPQRRRRVSLVTDFGGQSAPKILFERESMPRNFEKGTKEAKGNTNKDARIVAYSSKTFGGWCEDTVSEPIRASGGDYGGGSETLIAQGGRIRKKTPLETERCFGFPDGWTDIGEWTDTNGKIHKYADSPRYKALGNSIALPFWEWMAGRIVSELNASNPTMASLFDGIGGFPLVFSRCGCEPVWASEIEEFPIAVTKAHFPEKK